MAGIVRKDSFLKGALILTLAALVVKVIGVAQRIPLYRLLGAEGSGIFALPYPIYAVMLALSSVGFNIAISRLIAERVARGDWTGVHRVFRVSLFLMAALGLALSLVLAAAATFLAERVHVEPRAALSYYAVAPAVFFVALLSAYRGYFQGMQSMSPNGNSQVIEQVVRVITMLALAWLLQPWGLEWAAAGASFGAVTGAIAGWLYLLWVYWQHRAAGGGEGPHPSQPAPTGGSGNGTLQLIGEIVRISIPVSLSGIVLPLIQLIDAALVSARLQSIGVAPAQAVSQYGQLANVAVPLVSFPTILTSALFVALIPAITESLATGDMVRARNRSEAALRITFLFSLPAMVGLYLLAPPIAGLLFADYEAGRVLQALTSGLLFLTVQQTTSGILQGIGRVMIPVINMLLGAAVKLVLTYVLVGVPEIGVNGAAYATVIGFLVAAGLNMTHVTRHLGSILNYREMVLKPGLAVLAMGLVARAAYATLYSHTALQGLSSGQVNAVAALSAIVLGAAVYGVALLLLGGLKEADFEMIPRVGARLARGLKALGLLRG